MRITTLKANESSVSALVQRLSPSLTENQRKQAESDLLKANPHLVEGVAFKPGTVVHLPETLKPKANTASDDPVAGTLDRLQDALKGYGESGAKRIDAAQKELDIQEEILKNKEVLTAIKNAPEAAELAKELAASLKTARKNLSLDKKMQEELLGRIAGDLDTLLK
jgi:hypothetical protein